MFPIEAQSIYYNGTWEVAHSPGSTGKTYTYTMDLPAGMECTGYSAIYPNITPSYSLNHLKVSVYEAPDLPWGAFFRIEFNVPRAPSGKIVCYVSLMP